MKIRTAGDEKPVLFGQRTDKGFIGSVVQYIDSFYAHKAGFFEFADEQAKLFSGQGIEKRMGQHRNAVMGEDQADGICGSYLGFGDKAGGMRSQIFVKGDLTRLNQAMVNHPRSHMGAGDDGIRKGFCENVHGDGKAGVLPDSFAHLHISGMTGVQISAELLLKGAGMVVNKITKHMDVPVEPSGGKFNAGDDFQTGASGSANRLIDAVGGIVVGQGKSGQAGGKSKCDQFFRSQGTVRISRMDMQIYGLHKNLLNKNPASARRISWQEQMRFSCIV